MLRSLRLRLSLLYLMSALGLVSLLGTGTYGLLALYFQRSTDLALQYKMATEFRLRGLALPSELAAAEQSWLAGKDKPVQPSLTATSSTQVSAQVVSNGSDDEGEDGSSEQEAGTPITSGPSQESESDDRYNSSLAPVFVLPTAGGATTTGIPVVNDPASIPSAQSHGSGPADDIPQQWYPPPPVDLPSR